MNYLLQIVDGIKLSDFIIFIAALAFVVVIGIKAYKFIVKTHDALQEKAEKEEKFHKQITDDLGTLKAGYETLAGIVDDMAKKQKEIAVRQDEIESRTKKHDLNKLSDKLLRSYQYYTNESKNPMLAWSEMERDAFNKLFSDYEELGGNGYMHDTVQPAMKALEVVHMQDKDKFIKLMQSRKG